MNVTFPVRSAECSVIFSRMTAKRAFRTASVPMKNSSFPAYQENVTTTRFFISCISGKRHDDPILRFLHIRKASRRPDSSFPAYQENVTTTKFFLSCISGKRPGDPILRFLHIRKTSR
jgi:hypothetical protein